VNNRGFKAFPCFWGDPSDRRYYQLWEKAADRGLIAMFRYRDRVGM